LTQLNSVVVAKACFDFSESFGAVLLLWIRNTYQGQIALPCGISCERERRKLARTVDTQKCQTVILIFGHAICIAEPVRDNNLTPGRQFAVGNYVAASAHNQPGPVFDRFCRSCER